jgi:hypothetical protein
MDLIELIARQAELIVALRRRIDALEDRLDAQDTRLAHHGRLIADAAMPPLDVEYGDDPEGPSEPETWELN